MQKRSLRFNHVDELVANVDLLRSRGYQKLGEWELPQMLDHIAKVMVVHLDARGPWVPQPLRWIANRVIRRMVRKQKYPSIKLLAPRSMRPQSDVSDTAANASFLHAIDRMRAIDFESIATPTYGRLTRHEFMQLQLLHAAHHLNFLIPK